MIDAAHAQKQEARVVCVHAAGGHDLLGACAVDVPGKVALLARFDGAFCIEVVVGEVLELERIVDHHLGIHAAVRRLIDVLEEQSVEVLGNVNAPLVRVQCVIEHKSYNISLRVSRCLRTGPPPDLRHYYNRKVTISPCVFRAVCARVRRPICDTIITGKNHFVNVLMKHFTSC